MESLKGKIYLVPTPIGNMGDITLRAIEVLKTVDIVACEDTRHSGSLLKKLDIKKKLISYHNFNESTRAKQFIKMVNEGMSIAVITDAGTPGISDPAYRIVRAAIENDFEIIPLPGATAIIPALTASGMGTDRFFFEGFLPNKTSARQKRLDRIKEFEHTLIFFESPFRIIKTLNDINKVLGDREISLCREISKKFEEFIRGKTSEVLGNLKNRTVKGEITLVVEGKKE